MLYVVCFTFLVYWAGSIFALNLFFEQRIVEIISHALSYRERCYRACYCIMLPSHCYSKATNQPTILCNNLDGEMNSQSGYDWVASISEIGNNFNK